MPDDFALPPSRSLKLEPAQAALSAPEPIDFGMLINGDHVASQDRRWIDSIDPSTGRVWARIPSATPADVAEAVGNATEAAQSWAQLSATARGRILTRVGELVEQAIDDLVAVESRDNGKSVSELRTSLRSMATWFTYFGGFADKVHGEVLPSQRPHMLNYVTYEPFGVVAAILPWNSPLRLAAWKLAPAIAAGNAVVVKPSEHTSISILYLARLMTEAGLPPGVVNVVTGIGSEVVPPLVSHPDVAKVSFTGGAVGGAVVASLAATHMKPATLELGGKSAQIVFNDSDLDAAAKAIVAGVFASSGQTCLAGSRLLVQREVHDQVVDRVCTLAGDLVLGDPSDARVDVGPVATPEAFEKICRDVRRAVEEGATVATGGMPAGPNGRHFAPTVLTNVDASMDVFQTEVFGPVLSVTPFDDEHEAVALANNSKFGLAGGVWTRDIARGHRVARQIRAGTIWINSYRVTEPQSPFGGYGQSGIGREGGARALNSYMQVKSTWVDTSDTAERR